jgi:acyl carrier protein
MDELYEKVKKLIAEKLEIDEEKITLNASFRKDLGADSLDAYELLYALEEEMGIKISEEKASEFETVKDACEFIKTLRNCDKTDYGQDTSSGTSNNKSFTDIWGAAMNGTVEDVRYFIEEKGVNVDFKNDDGYAPLHEAVEYSNIEVVKFLVSKGANIHATDRFGFTPLHITAFRNISVAENIEIAKFLISKGTVVNVKTNEGNTPVDLAINCGCWEMVE